MFLQILNIIFDIQDITLCLKLNYYAFRHLGYSYLLSDTVCVTSQPGKTFFLYLEEFLVEYLEYLNN